MEILEIFRGVIGVAGLLALAWLLAERRHMPSWRLILAGVGLQIALAVLLTQLPVSQSLFAALTDAVGGLMAATREGTSFVFGYLGGGMAPFAESSTGTHFILAFQALPLVIVMSALSAIFWHLGFLGWAVRGIAYVMRRAFALSGAVSLGVAANIFMGMVESPVLIRPYLARMSRSTLFVVMTTGMATIAGTVMALYGSILEPSLPGALGHLLTASVISLPAAILVARIMVPADDPSEETDTDSTIPSPYAGVWDALTQGTAQGLQLFLNIAAMLIVLVALVALIDLGLGLFPDVLGDPLSVARLFGWLFAPLMWLVGIDWSHAVSAGQLMGQKTAINELVAYLALADLPAEAFSPREYIMLIYALSGFANFGSLGIMLGGMTALVPEQRATILSLGPRSLISGTLATMMTGAVIGMLY